MTRSTTADRIFAVTPTDRVDDEAPLCAWGTIVVCGMPFGGDPPFGDTHLTRALAARRRVLVVDRPVLRRRICRPDLSQVAPGFWHLRPWCLPGSDRPLSSLASDPVLARQIEWAASQVLSGRRVLITFAPNRGNLRGVHRDLTVYWRRDAAANTHYVPSVRHVLARHRKLLRSADLVTGVSETLVDDDQVDRTKSHLVRNGTDTSHFGEGTSDGILRDVRGPVIGYLGAVSWRLDLELIEQVARSRPDWTFALVGTRTVAVPDLPNIISTGHVTYSDLPNWAARFDVGIIPYRDDEFNRASFPLKVFEYLAAGTPVVSSPLPALDGFKPHVRAARSPHEFVNAIDSALRDGPSSQGCKAIAASNSWDARAADLERLISAELGSRTR